MKNVKIKVQSEYAAEFEAFCNRNNIPCILHCRDDAYTYLIRPGADATDALIMLLKMGWDGADEKDYNMINRLVMEHEYFNPQYEYELLPLYRQDEDILSRFVYPDW